MATAQLASQERRPTAPPNAFAPPRWIQSVAFWTFSVVAIGIAWRTTRLLLQFPIWGDESFVCVNFLDNTFSGIIGPLRVGQICPLTFLWSELGVYQWLGSSELAMRLLPFLAGLGALGLFWPLCRRVLPPVPAALAMALLAVSYYPVRHAVEVKPYAQDLLVALGLLAPAAWYLLNPSRLRWLIFLACFVPVAMISSYPAAFVAGSISIVLLPTVWPQPGRSAKAWFLVYNVLLLAAFLGHYFLVGKPQMLPNEGDPTNAFATTWQEWFPDYDFFGFIFWILKAHTGNMFAYPIGGPSFASSLTTVLCLAGVWSWWRSGNRHLLALIALPFLLSMLAAIIHKYPYGGSARVDQHLAPAICLLMGNGLAFAIERLAATAVRRRQAVVAALVLLAALGGAGLVRDVLKPYKTTAELWNRTLVQELMARVGPNDHVVVFHAPNRIRPGLEWYFRQHDDQVTWEGKIDWNRFDGAAGNLWCVQFYFTKPAADPVRSAVLAGGRNPRQLDFYQSIGPPEHGDDPETAEVFCFTRQ